MASRPASCSRLQSAPARRDRARARADRRARIPSPARRGQRRGRLDGRRSPPLQLPGVRRCETRPRRGPAGRAGGGAPTWISNTRTNVVRAPCIRRRTSSPCTPTAMRSRVERSASAIDGVHCQLSEAGSGSGLRARKSLLIGLCCCAQQLFLSPEPEPPTYGLPSLADLLPHLVGLARGLGSPWQSSSARAG